MSETQNEINFPKPEDFILRTPPYTVMRAKNYSDIIELEFFDGTIDSYCVECEKDSVFQRDFIKPRGYSINRTKWVNNYSTDDLIHEDIVRFDIDWQVTTFGPIGTIDFSDYLEKDRLSIMKFSCTRDTFHNIYVLFQFNNLSGNKIGQYPSIADLHMEDTKKYRKVLKKMYSEYTRAIGLSSHGVGIGSFVYLRRIFEYLIENAHQIAINDTDWDEEGYKNFRMPEKVNSLKSYLPPFLVDNKNIYSILSLGIHELDETDCQKYFQILRMSIELILDQELEKQKAKEKISSVSKELSKISSKTKE